MNFSENAQRYELRDFVSTDSFSSPPPHQRHEVGCQRATFLELALSTRGEFQHVGNTQLLFKIMIENGLRRGCAGVDRCVLNETGIHAPLPPPCTEGGIPLHVYENLFFLHKIQYGTSSRQGLQKR